ncbi:MAG: sigma-70 family RNA polymerase sigma factor [Planctomycetes bacterium]|nr:sigma-70 family RNA polymerase sigma factor [Planctomycetota bacterium]
MTEPPPSTPEHATCWTLVRTAAAGDAAARGQFARHYAAPIRAYLQHRWGGTPRRDDIDDAQQEVFVECLKPGGVLHRAQQAQGDFRALLFGVVRNVARRVEERAALAARRTVDHSVQLDGLPAAAEAQSRAFDRGWARAILREAAERHERAAADGDEGFRTRFRILALRHQEGLPIRAIAERLGIADVDRVHNAYRRARRDFRASLRDVVATRTGASPATLDDECRRVLAMLQG